MLGYTPEELRGTDSFKHVHSDDLALVRQTLQLAIDHPERMVKIQLRYQKKDGAWKRLELVGQNRLQDPEIRGLVTNWRDVTDRWRVEEELRNSERQYRLLFQDNPNPMWVFDLETLEFLEVNESAIQHYGYSREEFLAIKMSDLRQMEKNVRWEDAALTNSKHGRIWKHRRKDGTLIDVEVTWTPMVFRDRFAALTMITDITQRLRSEHHNEVFSKLSHRLSSATTASEAATIISEASDALFKWDDFALDLYSPEKDEVFSLLNITTVNNQRVEIPSSTQPKSANALIRRVINNGAELVETSGPKGHSAAAMLVPIQKGARVIGILFIQSHVAGGLHRTGFGNTANAGRSM